VAFVLSLAGSFLFFIVGTDFVVAKSPRLIQLVMSFLGLGSHFGNIAKGVIDSRDIFYYLSSCWPNPAFCRNLYLPKNLSCPAAKTDFSFR